MVSIEVPTLIKMEKQSKYSRVMNKLLHQQFLLLDGWPQLILSQYEQGKRFPVLMSLILKQHSKQPLYILRITRLLVTHHWILPICE